MQQIVGWTTMIMQPHSNRSGRHKVRAWTCNGWTTRMMRHTAIGETGLSTSTELSKQPCAGLRVDGAGQGPVLVRRGEEEDVALVRRCRCSRDMLFRLARRRARRREKPLLHLTAGIDVEAAARAMGAVSNERKWSWGAGRRQGDGPWVLLVEAQYCGRAGLAGRGLVAQRPGLTTFGHHAGSPVTLGMRAAASAEPGADVVRRRAGKGLVALPPGGAVPRALGALGALDVADAPLGRAARQRPVVQLVRSDDAPPDTPPRVQPPVRKIVFGTRSPDIPARESCWLLTGHGRGWGWPASRCRCGCRRCTC